MRIAVPMLFVEGANDPFCRLDLLEEVLAQVATPSGKAASPRKSGRKRYKSSAAGARTNPAAKPGVSRRQNPAHLMMRINRTGH